MTEPVKVRIYTRAKKDDPGLETPFVEQGFEVLQAYCDKHDAPTKGFLELQRLMTDAQDGELVYFAHIICLSKLPFPLMEQLVFCIRNKKLRVAVPHLLDLIRYEGRTQTEALALMQDMLLNVVLEISREEHQKHRLRQLQGIQAAKEQGKYKGRTPDLFKHRAVMKLRAQGKTIAEIAAAVGISTSSVTKIAAKYQDADDVPKL